MNPILKDGVQTKELRVKVSHLMKHQVNKKNPVAHALCFEMKWEDV